MCVHVCVCACMHVYNTIMMACVCELAQSGIVLFVDCVLTRLKEA